jgi:hypothetical protein
MHRQYGLEHRTSGFRPVLAARQVRSKRIVSTAAAQAADDAPKRKIREFRTRPIGAPGLEGFVIRPERVVLAHLVLAEAEHHPP